MKKTILKRYNAQRTRGSDGFGYVATRNGEVLRVSRAEREHEIEELLKKDKAPEIMFHHRWPTSTPNYTEMTHPIRVSHELLQYDYYVVHNGIIQNDAELKREHEKLGFKYTTELQKIFNIPSSGRSILWPLASFNDSEALAIELALMFDGYQDHTEIDGSIAFVAYQVDKNTAQTKNIFFGRNSNPLVMLHNKDMFILSSEGSGKDVDPYTIYALNADSVVSPTPFTLPAYKDKYAFHYYPSSSKQTAHAAPGWNDDDDDDDIPPDPLTDMTDDEYYQDLLNERQELLERIVVAQRISNYDEEMELQAELTILEDDIEKYEEAYFRAYDSTASPVSDGTDRAIGFSADPVSF